MTSSPTTSAGPRSAALATVLVLVLAGAVGGALWVWLWSPPTYTVTGGVASLGEVALSQSFTSDAWYVVVAGPLGLLVGLARRRLSGSSGLLDLLAAVVGSLLAAYVMVQVGELLGPALPTESAVAAMPDGSTVEGPLVLASALASQGWASQVYVVMIAWPLGVLAGWSAELVLPSLEPAHVREAQQRGWSADSAGRPDTPEQRNGEQREARFSTGSADGPPAPA